MIVVDTLNNGQFTTTWKAGMTASSLVQQLKVENGFHTKGNYTLQDITDSGRYMNDDDEVLDNRRFLLNAWLEKTQTTKARV